jgi:GlcNAc-P-P-Und epimerase
MNDDTCVIFGGTGFIGSHFADFLLRADLFKKILLIDIKGFEGRPLSEEMKRFISDGRVEYVFGDVRTPIDLKISGGVGLIANFAAVHREPGHKLEEYYNTNILGAENVCLWADFIGCDNIIFTSSIAPYGPTEKAKDESSIPTPVSAYGGSKLVAEKIHISWRNSSPKNRRLIIVRPGVVFGPGEGGNVSRLIKAVLGRYFFYMGNRDTRKAGVYVKELCNAMWWVFDNKVEEFDGFCLFNMSMNPGPSISEYVAGVCSVSGIDVKVFSVPYFLLLGVSRFIDLFASPLGINHPFSPVRIRKLVRSNNIVPKFLVDNGYCYKYTLNSAFEDWKKECPKEWNS